MTCLAQDTCCRLRQGGGVHAVGTNSSKPPSKRRPTCSGAPPLLRTSRGDDLCASPGPNATAGGGGGGGSASFFSFWMAEGATIVSRWLTITCFHGVNGIFTVFLARFCSLFVCSFVSSRVFSLPFATYQQSPFCCSLPPSRNSDPGVT